MSNQNPKAVYKYTVVQSNSIRSGATTYNQWVLIENFTDQYAGVHEYLKFTTTEYVHDIPRARSMSLEELLGALSGEIVLHDADFVEYNGFHDILLYLPYKKSELLTAKINKIGTEAKEKLDKIRSLKGKSRKFWDKAESPTLTMKADPRFNQIFYQNGLFR